ncbi:Eukaryotic translation initiation factor 4E [Thelohanellus kitauei]|uniref:Eukaryotic translation initiation factor 4E n=1 Tax=Thelohanellus kitauei TaxID=669202 RepID=A0A0C2NKA8_THEKT|nr:Eukaryotic translation initiation factor 4E [Thelohanellus kitauei]
MMIQPDPEKNANAPKKSQTLQHPLQNSWMLWFNKVNKSHAFEAELVKIHVVKTVEEFWSVFDSVKHPGDLEFMAEISLFKVGIDPKWEDPLNYNGGRWVFEVDGNPRGRQDAYLLTMLSIISDQLGDQTDLISGLSCSNRKRRVRVSIWLQVCDNRVLDIGYCYLMIRNRLRDMVNSKVEWYFETFESARNRCENRGLRLEKKHILR